jgi:hypothetical protein
MTHEKTILSTRLTTGDQYFVYATKTSHSEYVIRMTDINHQKKFISAIFWQQKLLPLGVPLAEFIHTDLDGTFSQFPSLLMKRLPGDDLCNVYSNLTPHDKKNLANEMIKIQAIVTDLPEAPRYGIADNDEETEFNSWYDFILNRLQSYLEIISKNAVFDSNNILQVISVAKSIETELRTVRATPFLWDASERNVLVYEGKISGIVDVDDMCFGDPLFVIALTSVALEIEGHDSLYADYWADNLRLNKSGLLRFAFYKLFYSVVFMRKHSMKTTNNQTVLFDIQRLKHIFQNSLRQVERQRE